MKPINLGSHSAYQNRVLTQLHKYYPDAETSLFITLADPRKFWALDLSGINFIMQDRYSVFGPEPRLPSDMLRAILVSIAFKITSYTRFASDLKENKLHAIISGFTIGIPLVLTLSMTSTIAFGYPIIKSFECYSST